MTQLVVLGSGSGGNALAVATEGDVLLVDAGFSAREITRRAAQVGLELSRVAGIVVTHEHGDHTAGLARLLKTLDVPLLASPGTWDRLRRRMPTARFEALRLMGETTAGPFRIHACPTIHDAAEPVALVIETRSGHRVGIAYDLGRPTQSVRYLLRQAHALVLEANHDEIRLRTSGYPPAVQERIAGSGGHLSNRAVAELLAELLHRDLQAVVLAHLSERCNTPADARAAVEPLLQARGAGVTLAVATQERPLPPIELRPVADQLALPGFPRTEAARSS